MQQVEVACDELALGDKGDRLATFDHDLEGAAGDLQGSLHRLVGIGDAGDHDGLGEPFGFCEFTAEELGGVVLGEDGGFEVEAAGEADVFMGGTCVAIDASMLAAAVGVDSPFEVEVGDIYWIDERARAVGEDAGPHLCAIFVFGEDFVEVIA